ncbi:MAG TPA: hypothetical protein PLC92_01650, partial [Chitinophagales bacterium]|nr:hypothetical protein [Chitinophagales bacterium]
TISALNTAGTDCDANCLSTSDNQLDWVWDIDDGGTDVDEACYNLSDDANSNSSTPNFAVFDYNADFACQWPTGNIDFYVEGWDEDCADACIGGGFGNVVSELACSVNVNSAYPANNATNGNHGPYTATCSYNRGFNGGWNCVGTITVTYRWEVSGSYRSQSSDNYICGAYDMGTLNTGGSLNRNNFSNIGYSTEDICSANEPNNDSNDETVWLKYTTSANPGTAITVDVDAIGGSGSGGVLCISGGTVFGWTRVYEGPTTFTDCPFTYSTNPFTLINQVGSVGSAGTDNSLIEIRCPKPNQTYYIQVEMQGVATCDMGRYNVSVSDNGRQAGPDRICNALDIGQPAYGGPLLNTTNTDLFINNQSNACASTASGEPDAFPVQGIDRTVWYKFTTPSAPAGSSTLQHTYEVFIDRLSSSASTSWPTFAVYKETTSTTRNCSPENGASFANLSLIDYTQNLDFGDASVNLLCLDPSST